MGLVRTASVWHSFLHRVAEGLLQGCHAVGHVWGVGELGGAVHEVIHGRAAGVPVGEVKVAVALVVVAWGKQMGGGGSLRGKTATPGLQVA